MVVYCRFSGVREEETASRLLGCVCKSAFYGRDHKKQCQSKRGTSGAA